MLKIFVRNATFESNSSSSHVLAVAESDVYDRPFELQIIRTGKVRIPNVSDICARDEWMRLYLPENILSFLIVSEIENAFIDSAISNLREAIAVTVTEVGNSEVDILPLIRGNFPVIDKAIAFLEEDTGLGFEFAMITGRPLEFETNNLAPEVGCLEDFGRLKRALFNKQSYVELQPENDLGLPPPQIETDIGGPYIVPDYEKRVADFEEGLRASMRTLKSMARKWKQNPPKDV
jgi:hypothetical protein